MRTFGNDKNYAVWDVEITATFLQERTTGTTFPINPDEVKPRYLKAVKEKKSRTDKKAEVFTPYELVKIMNDMLDIDFKGSRADYIKRAVIEVTCGEAPYLTTRYDATTGKDILIADRIGLLDRKLSCIPASVGKAGYEECVTEALKASYGYEWQFDSIYLARRNMLLTVIEHYVDRFGTEPDKDKVKEWAYIISYNIFRMDGVTKCIPETKIPAKVMNWTTGKMELMN